MPTKNKFYLESFFAYYISLQRKKSKKNSQKDRSQGFSFFFCLIMEGSGSDPGSIRRYLYGWLKNFRIRIRIHNTAVFISLTSDMKAERVSIIIYDYYKYECTILYTFPHLTLLDLFTIMHLRFSNLLRTVSWDFQVEVRSLIILPPDCPVTVIFAFIFSLETSQRYYVCNSLRPCNFL